MTISLDPLGDGKSSLRLLDSMGNSLSVVNDARQSFDAESTEWTERDGKLLGYLAKHHHTSPFRGVVFKWSVKAPLFIARQWWKHTVASTFVDDQLFLGSFAPVQYTRVVYKWQIGSPKTERKAQ